MVDEFVDINRIERRLDELWDIGKTDNGGVTRLAYSEEESEAIDYVLGELPDEYEIWFDPIGNTFASRHPASERSLFAGSHLDSVYNGGRLDGTLGVVTALEAIEAVHATGSSPSCPPTLAIFRAEESSRFGQHTIGSRGALGMLTVEDFSATDDSGVPLWQAMQQMGLQPTILDQPTLELDRVAGFLESHIEQGRVLDDANDGVGVVTSIRAPVRYHVVLVGQYDHSGATPMNLRQDALTAAAACIGAIERIGKEAHESGDIVVTVGNINAVEGAINKVCGEVTFPIDIRSNNVDFRDEIENRILDTLNEVSQDRGVRLELNELDRSEPVELDESMVGSVSQAAEELGIEHRKLPSGGGHDAMNFQLRGVPTAMVFTPSIDGVSHNPEESTPTDAIEAATSVMAKVLLEYEPDG